MNTVETMNNVYKYYDPKSSRPVGVLDGRLLLITIFLSFVAACVQIHLSFSLNPSPMIPSLSRSSDSSDVACCRLNLLVD